MKKTKSNNENFISHSPNKVVKNKYIAAKATKKGVHSFLASLNPQMKKSIQNKFQEKSVFKLLSTSFFGVEVVDQKTGRVDGLFFYGLEGKLAPEKWGLPIPLHDFDFCGSLFLQVSLA